MNFYQVKLLIIKSKVWGSIFKKINFEDFKNICQSNSFDLDNINRSGNRPYVQCNDRGELKIIKATLALSTSSICPSQFRIDLKKVHYELKNCLHLENTDVTESLKYLLVRFKVLK